nr:ABC transporter permease subunit [uncultured Sellimonas sp.]
MISTTANKKKKRTIRLWAVAVWLLVWQAVSAWIGQEILLVSPVVVFRRLTELVREAGFWQTIGFSLVRILGGFLLAMAAGILAAGLSARFRRIRELLAPAVLTIKAVPVASFVILVLIWVPSRNLSIVISFLMVFPILYTNVLDGILGTDPKLLEMAKVFEVPKTVQIRYIYVSQVLPFFRAGCSVGLGLCWKAGVAAEVIGIPDGSIGENLYNAKVYLNTPDLFAWTVVIVLISLVFEKLFLAAVDQIVIRLERMG